MAEKISWHPPDAAVRPASHFECALPQQSHRQDWLDAEEPNHRFDRRAALTTGRPDRDPRHDSFAAAMTTVSLSHIAGGVEHIIHGAIPHWQAWGVAAGLDVNYVAMEMAGIVAAMQHVKDRLHRLTRLGIPAVMGFSMSLNALEFAAGATNTYELAAGIAMGVILPALVFLTFRVAAVLADV